ncbi:MAG: DNA translocase FtsK 4TM domain-containing protein, partial [Bacteroidaceae bacterium]|nr:DNA translocase FtsK 4TM domain-containing protein [Bacteroidaceae bacterium]
MAKSYGWLIANVRSTDDLTEEERRKRQSNRRFVLGLVLAVASLAILLAMVSHIFTGAEDQKCVNTPGYQVANWLGMLGYYIAYNLIDTLFGVSTIFIPILLLAISLRVMGIARLRIHKWFLHCMLLMLWISAMLSYLSGLFPVMEDSYIQWGGGIGKQEVECLIAQIGSLGTALVLGIVAVLYLAYVSDSAITSVRERVTPKLKAVVPTDEEDDTDKTDEGDEEDTDTEPDADGDAQHSDSDTTPFVDDAAHTATTIDFSYQPTHGKPTILKQGEQELPLVFEKPEEPMSIVVGQNPEEANLGATKALEPYDPKLDLSHYKYPTIDLLKKYDLPASAVDWNEQQENKNQIINILRTFGVEISSIKATVGPTITLYEITPAPGVKISKIRNL